MMSYSLRNRTPLALALSTTLLLPDVDEPLNDAAEIRERLEHLVDLVIDGGSCGILPTTVIDMTQGDPLLVREGAGALGPLGLVATA